MAHTLPRSSVSRSDTCCLWSRSASYRALIFGGFAFVLSVMLGCPTTPTVRNDGKATFSEAERVALLRKIKQKQSKVMRLEGRAKLRVYSRKKQKKRSTYRVVFQIERPNRIHLQVIAAMQQPAVIVTCDGKKFAVHNLLNKEFIRGPMRRLPEFLEDFLPLRLPLHQLIGALLGDVPLLKEAKAQLVGTSKKNEAKLMLERKPLFQSVWIDLPQLRYNKSVLLRGGKSPFTLEYSGYDSDKQLVPNRIEFRVPARKLRVTWIYLDKEANTKIPATQFTQKLPAGAKTRVLQ